MNSDRQRQQELVDRVREIIDRHDPFSLREMGAPANEFEPLARRIVNGLSRWSDEAACLTLVGLCSLTPSGIRPAAARHSQQWRATSLRRLIVETDGLPLSPQPMLTAIGKSETELAVDVELASRAASRRRERANE